ncbi:ATP-binding protein [Caenimonas terrae]|uniref:histidine kinase n=1 Tax=Caenimonas terrae TaxID=696074 RepID=A0ABW0NMD3_9BURK
MPNSPATDPSAPVIDARWVAAGLRMQVLVPLALALVLLVSSFVAVLVLARMKRNEMDIARSAAAADVMLQERTSHEVQTMRTVIELIMRDPNIEAAFRNRDRQALLDLSMPIRDGIWTKNSISRFDYILPDKTVLLRVEAPGDHGDKFSRFLLEESQYDKPFWGSELGPQGDFTLQVVYPWRVDEKLIGYLQLGIDFEQLMEGIKTALDADVFVAIDKSYLDAGQWQQRQARKEEPIPWDEFPQVVVLNRTLKAIPPSVQAYLSQPAGREREDNFEFAADGRVVQTIGVPFMNRLGQRLGVMVVMEDMTAAAAGRTKTVVAIIAVVGAAGSGLMLFFYVLLGRVQRGVATRTARLNDAQRVLVLEQQERQRAEQELGVQQERNELLETRSRMVEELAAANQKAEAALRSNQEVTGQLRAMQSELLATARQAGRAEIATNVLHNVGNVLNSVNVSAGLMGAALRRSRLPGLTRAVRLIDDHSTDLGDFLSRDEKGRMLPGYIAAVTKALVTEQQCQFEELARLAKSIDHIKDIVTVQQSHATGAGVIELVLATELAEDALRMQAPSLTRHRVTVIREFTPVPPIPMDRGQVLQILVNLISNARQAMAAMPAAVPRLTLRVELSGTDRLRIAVCDQGEGISAENLTRIFAHGFTTRSTGHGFGLHSSALAARAMGGTLTAASEGPGKGATFTLELPVDPTPPDYGSDPKQIAHS